MGWPVSHRKLSKGARQALLARFPPDGYVPVDVMDQTTGSWTGDSWTIRHAEALLFASKAEADEALVLARCALSASHVRLAVDDPDDPNGPWIEPVQVERHFRDMQDLEFTVERGKLYLLQTRTGQRTAAAAVRTARNAREGTP